MKKLIIQSKMAANLLNILGGRDNTETLDVLNKALVHKYIRRWPAKNGKGWEYLYPKDFLTPVKALLTLFGFKKEKLEDDYTKNNIQKDYGADKKIFSAHVLEYFSNKLKWDTFFAKKENREKTKKPQNMAAVKKTSGTTLGGDAEQGELGLGDKPPKKDNKPKLNVSLMHKVWGMYSGQEDKDEGKDSSRTGRNELPAGTAPVRTGRGKENGDSDVPEAEAGDNGGKSVQLSFELGERAVGDVSREGGQADTGIGAKRAVPSGGRRKRLTERQTKNIRQDCLDLLNSKTDAAMTEEDKALLRQYEGAGGLGEVDASTHGTLYEFYTPRNIVNKVWQLVDKYLPGRKNVLEPSAGIGRFAENRPIDKFTLNEIDDVSSRIAGILNPDAEIKHGVFQALFKPDKQYEGKKYDCVIGNPPYGAYSGLWKGKGEGKEHNRYEEYFIDRGLDTLRDGGIMAFVVPQGFLDSANDKIKAKIAEKGRLLEAWRLPNGVFSTTGVGTDIVVIRKEKGLATDFSDGAYFKDNSTHILGDVTERMNQFGKMQKYVSLSQGETFDGVIDGIPADAVAPAPVGEPSAKEAAEEKVETKKVKKSEAEKKRNRSEAMLGNQNAAGRRNVDSAAEFNAKYNKHIAPEALPVWKATQWDGSIDVNTLDKKSKDYIEKSGNYVRQADGRWYDMVNFASGNIYEKLEKLETSKEALSKAEYERQKSILEGVLPKPKQVTEFEVSPLSAFAEKFVTGEVWAEDAWDAVSVGKKFKTRRQRQEAQKEMIGEGKTLVEAFKQWIRAADEDELALGAGVTKTDIQNYVEKTRVVAARASTPEGKEAARAEAARTVTARREAAERLFNQYIRERLSLEDQKRLADAYNRQYNGTVPTDITKIPVFLDGISREFKGKKFWANESQMKGVSWTANQGNGIIAFDVGVGKMLDNDEPVLTPDGWKRNGDLKEDDFVIAIDGTPTKVLKVFPHKNKPIYKMTFSDGSYSLCGDEHLWEVQRANERAKYPGKWRVMTTLDIKSDLDKTRRARQWSIPMCEPVQFPKRTLKIAPYVMGALIGNGGFSNRACMFSSADNFTIEKVTSLLPDSVYLKYIDRYDYRITAKEPRKGNDIATWIGEYGLRVHHSFDKFIPDDYLFSSIEDRVELLHGLMDTDGTVGGGGNGTPIYYTTSEELAGDVKELVQSLGGTASITEKQGKYKKNGGTILCRVCYSVTMRVKINPFSIPRKAELYKEHAKYFPSRFIDSVEFYKNSDATCILVEHPRHLYLTRDYIVTHNTITAIMAAMNDIQMGRCQKPVICVPKAVYKNWISEISQLFPGVTINALGNFGDISSIKNADGTLNIAPGSLTLCTHEALEKIGFKEETLEDDLRESFSEAISVMTEEDRRAVLNGSKKAQRKSAKDKEDIMTRVGKASRTAGGNWVNWEDTGFDHITVDEAHNFRNSFSRPKNLNRGDADEFRDVPSGSEAQRGLKLFAVTQMVQKRNNGRNVHLLTATPFQNSPGEIYNMLSYVAREKLKEAGIENYHEFLTQFIELKNELSVDSKGNVTDKNVVKGFKNLGALQSLLNQYVMKIDGEDAGIIRPDKTEHIIELNPTAEQRDITERIREYMEKGPDPKKDPGATLRCLNALRQAALSPALVDGFAFIDGDGEITVKNKDFVKSSPKMTFVCDTATRLYKQHPDKGQIIHLPQGVSHYPDVKKYLVSQGVPEDAITFLAPEHLKSGDAGIDQKEEITKAFNDPENKLKIIIGSDTIKEGVNLNGNTIQTYECMLAWNPTDTQQLKGRSWRQGNKQGMVHITFPLMNDSVDSFMYQKHDEKGTRLDTLYNSQKDKIDVDGIDPEELKFSLIKDPKKRADMQIKAETAELQQKQNIAESVSDKIFKMSGEYKDYKEENEERKSLVENLQRMQTEFASKSDDALKAEYDLPDWIKGDISKEEMERIRDAYLYDGKVGVIIGKSMKELREKYAKAIKERIANAQKTMQRNKGKMETIANTLSRYGITDVENMAIVEEVRKNYSEQALSYKARIEVIEIGREQRVREAAAQIKAESRPGVSVDEAIKLNSKEVGENLYSMDMVKSRIEKEKAKRGAATLQKSIGKKKLVLIMKRRTA